MKKKLFIMSMLIGVFAIAIINTSCEEEPLEACEEDLFCEDTVEVTACCTDGEDCYFTYNGIDYPDTPEGLADLIIALDCAKSKSINFNGESELEIRLKSLVEDARFRSRK